MGAIFLNVTGRLIRKCRLLLLLVSALMLAPSAREVCLVVGEFDPLASAQTITREVDELVPTKKATQEEIERKLRLIRTQLGRKIFERDALKDDSCYLSTCSLAKEAKLFRIDLAIDIISQALTYGEAISKGQKA